MYLCTAWPISCQPVSTNNTSVVFPIQIPEHSKRCNKEKRSECFLIYTTNVSKFLIIKPTSCTNFSNLFLEWNSTGFGQFLCPSSGVFHFTHSNGICHTGLLTACEQEHLRLLASFQQACMTYTIAVCTVKNSWRWIEELSETCRVSFQI